MHRLHSINQYLAKVNFFEDDTDDEYKKRNQILSTRLYIILFIIILITFTLYTSLSSQTNTITISKPTQNQYEELQMKFSNTLQCPCEDISIIYEKFINIKLIYHEICSSSFISQNWINFLFHENMSYYFQLDFRYSATAQFQTLQILCQQVKQTINDSLIEFYSIQLITPKLISHTTFIIQINSSIETFKRTTQILFQNLIQLFRTIVINNELFSAQDTSNTIVNRNQNNNNLPVWLMRNMIKYYHLSNQSNVLNCYENNGTINKLPGGIYTGSIWDYTIENSTISIINATVILPGIFIGCLPMESLFQSTLECFFNQTCLNIIISYINHSTILSNSFSVLNKSRFVPSTTIETLMNELFIEEWIIDTSYVQYFNQCQPSFCQYSNEERNSVIYILTMMISLYGGLKASLSSLVPIFITFIRKKKQQQQVSNVVEIPPKVPLKTRLYSLFQNGIHLIFKLNIFDSQSTNQYMKQNDLISTRIYLILLPISLAIIALYTSLAKQTKIITINYPTQIQFEELNNSLVNNPQCPCSQISSRYDKFITFKPIYHQLCSSLLISNLWYETNYWLNYQNSQPNDFRWRSSKYFSLLSKLCELSNTTITNSLIQFYSNEYVTSHVVTTDVFRSQINSFIDLFESTTLQSFKQTLDIFRNLTFANLLTSTTFSNVDFYLFNDTGYPIVRPSIIDFYGCSCAIDSTCKKQSDIQTMINFYFTDFSNIYMACFTIESLLFSTIECFFDEDCILRIKSYMNPHSILYKNLEVMSIPKISRYQINTPIETMIDNLFIEDWKANYSYEKYYTQCKPSYCSYTILQRPDILYVLLKLIGIFGGLSIVLKFLIPIIVNKIRRENKQQQQEIVSNFKRIHHILRLLKEKFLNLNLFKSNSNTIHIIRYQQLTTRFYLIFLLIILIILILYTSLNKILITINIELINQIQYEYLKNIYSNTLHCPCNQISIEYEKFIQINISSHQICSSNFINKQWINYLYNYNTRNEKNFRAIAASQFLILSSLCQLTKKIIDTNIKQFYATKFLSAQLISSDLFEIQINSFIKSFQLSISQIFKRTLDITRGLIQGNSFLSGYETNWKFTVLNTYYQTSIHTNPQSYNNNSCNCAISSKCIQPAIITDEYPLGLPGLLIGCYPLETILQSSLECLYNQTCLDLILIYINKTTSDMIFSTLKLSLLLLSGYNINETIQQMVDRLFIDEWNFNKSYDKYYQQCASGHCTYSYIQNFDIFYIFTTILALYGGLSKVLKIIVPIFVYFILWILNRKTTIVVPFTESENNIS